MPTLRGLPLPGPVRAMGASADAVAAATAGSPNLRDGVFGNREPAAAVDGPGPEIVADMLRRPGAPRGRVPVLLPVLPPQPADLAITWLGHASAIVDLDGVRVLLDPVLSARCSPSQRIGPRRMHVAPYRPGAVPGVDVILLSHDHYDHLDHPTVTALAAAAPAAVFVAPIGVDAHLRSWGVDRSRIVTADWGQSVDVTVRGTTVSFGCTPARHFSGRGFTRNNTLWASWAVAGPRRSFFFSGDTGFTDAYREVGERYGPFDVTLIAVGAYDVAWPDIHLNPEEAVQVHRLVNGGDRDSLLVPIHWGTFNLARHPWAEPIGRLLPAADRARASVCVPRVGSTIAVESRTGTAFDDPTWWERNA